MNATQIKRINALWLFGAAGSVMGCIVAVLILEPRGDLGPRWGAVEILATAFSNGRPPDSFQIEVEITLPNGNPHTVEIYAKWITARGWLCLQVALGRWTGTDHTDIEKPETCGGLLAPKAVFDNAQHSGLGHP